MSDFLDHYNGDWKEFSDTNPWTAYTNMDCRDIKFSSNENKGFFNSLINYKHRLFQMRAVGDGYFPYALCRFSGEGHIPLVNDLLNFFDDVDLLHHKTLNGVPLRAACIHGQEEMVRFLLSRGANPNNYSAVYNSFLNNHEDIAFLLVTNIRITCQEIVDELKKRGWLPKDFILPTNARNLADNDINALYYQDWRPFIKRP